MYANGLTQYQQTAIKAARRRRVSLSENDIVTSKRRAKLFESTNRSRSINSPWVIDLTREKEESRTYDRSN
jgi:hypothetical protein